jgi:hypothetical protein
LTYHGADVDDAAETLTSFVTYLPQKGKLYRYVASGDSYEKGTEVTDASTQVSATTPGVFNVVFVPTADTSGFNYATISFIIQDPHGARSSNAFVTINVLPVNKPPQVNVGGPYTVTTGQLLPIPDTNVYDADGGNFPLLVTITLDQGSIGTFTLSDERAFNQNACQFNNDKTVLTCKASQTKLNGLLATLTFQSDSVGQHYLNVLVDDLNNGGTFEVRGQPGLTDSDQIQITVIPPSVTVVQEGNNDLTIALAVSGAGAALFLGIGAIAFRKKLKRAAPADDYFDFMNEASSDVKSNPLFQSKYNGGSDNPVYESKA